MKHIDFIPLAIFVFFDLFIMTADSSHCFRLLKERMKCGKRTTNLDYCRFVMNGMIVAFGSVNYEFHPVHRKNLTEKSTNRATNGYSAPDQSKTSFLWQHVNCRMEFRISNEREHHEKQMRCRHHPMVLWAATWILMTLKKKSHTVFPEVWHLKTSTFLLTYSLLFMATVISYKCF